MHTTVHPSYRETIRSLFLPLLGGLLTAQIIGTGFVYNANKHLYNKVLAATDAGYFAIPAGPVTDTLTTLKSAILGGLFYTLSIGVGLTLVSWAALMLWQMALKRDKRLLGMYLLIWASLLIWVNQKGITLYPSLFCLLVPLVTAFIFLRGTATHRFSHIGIRMVPVAALVLLTAIWATQFDRHLFTAIRDHVLLTNPVGRTVNDFYYRYTLYAAESFKSLTQKNMRSYHIETTHNERLVQQVTRRLAQFDMLYLPNTTRPDFTVAIVQDHKWVATTKGKQIETPLKEALAKPRIWLQQLSQQSDRYAPLRRITLAGLLIGFPVFLFVMVYGMVRIAVGMALPERSATFVASGLSVLIGLLLFFPMIGNQPPIITEQDITRELEANEWSHRVAALRFIEKKKIDISRYPQYRPLLESPLVTERYYLARALAVSRSPASYKDLKSMLGDNHPNVICQVFYALGRQGHRAAIEPILSHMATSDHWYTQWYGYNALRRLGWYPTPSKQSP